TGRPLVEIVLNWTVQKDFVSTTLCGIRNADQAKQDCQAFDWLLSDEQMRTIDEAIDTYIDFDGVPPME
ncbi:MAG: aldo/keto reductase, partial [Erysipelotrichaceae bacterium]|nr:aldo/keto reductase [Erysipelotrichaceae bacterium]